MCMTQPWEPREGLGRRKALAAKIGDAVYTRGPWGSGIWLPTGGLSRVSGEASVLQSPAPSPIKGQQIPISSDSEK